MFKAAQPNHTHPLHISNKASPPSIKPKPTQSHETDHPYQPAVPTDISETVLVLLKHGANPLTKDHAGFTPLALARGLRHQRCIDLLQVRVVVCRCVCMHIPPTD